MPLSMILDAAMKNQRNVFVVRELQTTGRALRYKCEMQAGDLAVEVCGGKITDIWMVE
jgi:hypothetical protein